MRTSKMIYSTIIVFILSVKVVFAAEKVELVSFDYPPMLSNQDPKGGLLGEIVHEAFKQELIELSIDFYPPKRVHATMIGTDKTLATLIPINLVRRIHKENEVTCITPITNIHMVFYYYAPRHKNPIIFEKIEDIKPYSVGTIRGSNATSILKNAGIKTEESAKESQIKKLYRGRVDLALMGFLTGEKLIKEFYPNKINGFKILNKPLMELPSSICFNKKFPNSEKFIKHFVKGFDKIRKNGVYVKILEKYYGTGKIPEKYNSLFEIMDSNYILDWSRQ